MTARYRSNSALYKENTRPRQIRGYLAFCGLDDALKRVADSVATVGARRTFESLVPEEIHGECDTILFRDGEFCVYAHRSDLAGWLRNRQERLERGFAENGIAVRRIKVVVSPRGGAAPARPVDKPLAPASGTARVVLSGARAVSHPGLKAALTRLAMRLERSES